MISEVARRLRENIQKVIVGKDEVIDLTLVAVLCEGHILLEDVPGIGKTTLARALAVSLGCTFRRIQFTPDLLPSDVTGLSWFNQKEQEFEFRPGPIMSQVVLADEINRATPRTQSALLEAMQERQVTADGVTRPLPRPFLVLATQNPVELEGTFPLPEAQVDRFLLRIAIGYPTEGEENAILERFRLSDPLPDLQTVTSAGEILGLQASDARCGWKIRCAITLCASRAPPASTRKSSWGPAHAPPCRYTRLRRPGLPFAGAISFCRMMSRIWLRTCSATA